MLRHLAAVVAVLAFGVWGWMCLCAMSAPETYTAAGERMWAFLIMVIAAFVRDDKDEEETL